MKTSFIKSLAFMCAAFLLFNACTKDNEEPQPVLKPAEKQVQEVIKELEKLPDVSQFTEELKKIDVANVETEELTVFAVKNAGMQVSVVTKTGLTTEVLKRHIAKGAYELKDLTDKLELFSITGDTLRISRVGDDVTINSVPIQTTGTKVGKSMVYVIPEVIPEKEKALQRRADITVFMCNEKWTPENNAQGFPLSDAQVKVYKANKELIDSCITDKNGKVSLFHNETEIYYTANKGDTLTNIYDGFRVVGLFTSEKDIANWPVYRLGTVKPGSMKFVDLNGDGQIDNNDKVADKDMPAIEYIQYINDETLKESVLYLFPKALSPIAKD